MKGHTPPARSVAKWKNRRRPNRSPHGRAERQRRAEQAARVKQLLAPLARELKARAAERAAAAEHIEVKPGTIRGARFLNAAERALVRLAKVQMAREDFDARQRKDDDDRSPSH